MEILTPEQEHLFSQATHVVGIGAARCGTTWLYNYLNNHPQVVRTKVKEIHYFDAKYLYQYCGSFVERLRAVASSNTHFDPHVYARLAMFQNESAYIDYFKMQYTGQKIFCDITPSYSILGSGVFGIIDSMHANTKYVYIMRNPAERVWSTVQFNSNVFGKPWQYYHERFLLNHWSMVLRSDYRRTLSELLSAIPRDRVLILFYENLFCDESIDALCNFLEIEKADALFTERINATQNSMPMETSVRRLYVNILAPIYFHVLEKFKSLPDGWLSDLDVIDHDYNSFYDHYSIDVSSGTTCNPDDYSDFRLDGPLFYSIFGGMCQERGDVERAQSLLLQAEKFKVTSR